MGTINNSSDEPDRPSEGESFAVGCHLYVGIEIVDRASHQMARKYRFLPLKLTLSEIGLLPCQRINIIAK